MNELSALAGSKGYGACDDARGKGRILEKVALPLFRHFYEPSLSLFIFWFRTLSRSITLRKTLELAAT